MPKSPPKIAIVGRPNVGKSTLFNRLAGKKLALTDNQPGVTRDRKESPGRLHGLDVVLVDTAGFENSSNDSLQHRMEQQTQIGIASADIILFLIDARTGVLPLDLEFAQRLRSIKKPVVLVANKAEGRDSAIGASEGYALGLGKPIEISAAHGEGLFELEQQIKDELYFSDTDPIEADPFTENTVTNDHIDEREDNSKPIRFSIVGRPNAGKSTLINALIKENRLLTGPEAGITRDAIDIEWSWKGHKIKLTDTAGMRKKARIDQKLEKMSVSDSLRAIQYAHVVGLCMEADRAFDVQDLKLADLIVREGRAIVLIINKWDLVDNKSEHAQEIREKAETLMAQTRGVPIIYLSALSGKGIPKLMPAVAQQFEHWNAKIKTRDLNDWLSDAVSINPPPAIQGRPIKIRYMSQIKSRPPTFVAMASRGDKLPESYKRYLTNSIKNEFDLPGIPIRLEFRKGKNPFENQGT